MPEPITEELVLDITPALASILHRNTCKAEIAPTLEALARTLRETETVA